MKIYRCNHTYFAAQSSDDARAMARRAQCGWPKDEIDVIEIDLRTAERLRVKTASDNDDEMAELSVMLQALAGTSHSQWRGPLMRRLKLLHLRSTMTLAQIFAAVTEPGALASTADQPTGKETNDE